MIQSAVPDILFATSEIHPFSKTGGLADVSSALPLALAANGLNITIVTPYYREVKEGGHPLRPKKIRLEVPFRSNRISASLLHHRINSRLEIYFIQKDEFFDRSGLYGASGEDYFDNAERFSFFSQAVLELCRKRNHKPSIIHCNDWQTAVIPALIKTRYKLDPHFRNIKILYTIHNLAYQGIFPQDALVTASLSDELYSVQGLEFYGKLNFMKGGLIFSDAITTVSRRYSEEILQPDFGYGLEGVLKERKNRLFGVLNGVDYKEWDPENDSRIIAQYSPQDLSGKLTCKQDLHSICRLDSPLDAPLLGMVTRLAEQKGLTLLIEIIPVLMEAGCSLVILGSGGKKLEKELMRLSRQYKKQMAVFTTFDETMAHKIEAGSDIYLMPSRYEPCGLNQMYSLKYGTIPVVHATGGLDDTIIEFNFRTKTGNGFKFTNYTAVSFLAKTKRALACFRKKNLWRRLMINAMSEDFSWTKSAQKYMDIYFQLNRGSLETRRKKTV